MTDRSSEVKVICRRYKRAGMRLPVILDDVEKRLLSAGAWCAQGEAEASHRLQWSPASPSGRSRLEGAELVLDGSLSGMSQF